MRTRTESLLADGYRLALVAAHHDTPATLGGTARPCAIRVVYLLVAGPPDSRIELHLRLDPDAPAVPSLAELSFPAGRFEREMHDLYGIEPTGHPLPRRLVRHPHWPHHWYPMRADAGEPPPFGDPEGPYPFLTVEGPGVYEIPVGPVHAGLIEPGHFRFSVVGETILKLKARLWFLHRGVEKLFEGHPPAAKLPLAERISGDTAVGHALAYCLAVEDAQGLAVSPDAQRGRAFLLELERLHNHVADLGALCNDVGHSVLHAHAGRLRERLLRLNARVTGHRLLRGGVHLGGTRLQAIPEPGELQAAARDAQEIVALALGHSVVRDRFTGTAVLPTNAARDLGALGYVARASGLPEDARLAHPHYDLRGHLRVPTHSGGDVLARFLIRADEIDASLALLTHLADTLTPGPTGTWPPPPRHTGPASGVGIVEGWRGTITHRVELDDNDTLTRVKVVDPSFFNWPALPVALAGTIVPDFPLANKSFNLSYAGNDL
ncbi:NADH-quinone oxidoreductase subunit C [Pseudofrankia sp. DC12]|uniref:NADH-quinone oxidoreductase subunit D-related protein n=1 Tax=Pseudofrankia sp. DC12 TaxID=683315 RepID=UPI0005F82172